MNTQQKIALADNIAGGLGFVVYFSAYLKQTWQLFLENPVLLHSLRVFLFPFIVLTDVIRTILSWHQAKRENFKTAPLIRALHDTASTAVAITAVTLAFTIGAVNATVAPLMFTSLLAFNSLVHLTSAIYYAFKSNPQARNDHFVGFITSGLFAAGIGALTFVGNSALAIIGLTGAALGVGYAIYKGYKEFRAQKAQNQKQETSPEEKVQAKTQKPQKSLEIVTPQFDRQLSGKQGSAITQYHGSLINKMHNNKFKSQKTTVNDTAFHTNWRKSLST